MCNAYNHSASCTCGWGGTGSTGYGIGARRNSGYTFYSDSSYYDSLVRESFGNSLTYKTTCWYCGEEVFFHTNGYGDCVLFDELGYPWEIHDCWKNYCLYSHNFSSIATFSEPKVLKLTNEEQKKIMLKGVIKSLQKQHIPPTIGKVAEQLGIFFISQFKILYEGLFYEENGLVKYGQKPKPKPNIVKLKKNRS